MSTFIYLTSILWDCLQDTAPLPAYPLFFPNSARNSRTRLQSLPDPLPGQPRVLVCYLDAGGGVALQHGGQHGGAAAGEGVQDMASRFGDLHDIPHQLEGLLRQVDALLGIAVLEHAGEAGYPRDGRSRRSRTPWRGQ